MSEPLSVETLVGRAIPFTPDIKELTMYVNDLTTVLHAAIDRINQQQEAMRIMGDQINRLDLQRSELEAKYEGHTHYCTFSLDPNNLEPTITSAPVEPPMKGSDENS